MNKSNILIIGGSGFIGLNLSLYLNNKYKIFILGSRNYFLDNLLLNNDDINLISITIDDISTDFLKKHNFESIIWLAHSSVPASNVDLYWSINKDVFPIINFLNKLKKIEFPVKFIYFSSGGAIYGNPVLMEPISEFIVPKPISNYGYIKQIAENTIQYNVHNSNISALIVRPSNVYGIFQNYNKPQGLIPHIFKCSLKNDKLSLYDDGNITRDYINIKDLCNFISKILEKKISMNFDIFNVGSQVPIKNHCIINLIQNITSIEIEIVNNLPRIFDCSYNVLNISKANILLDWKPEINLYDGICNYWEWFKLNFNEK